MKNIMNNKTLWWEKIRMEELETALEIFSNEKNLDILEIGGRDGFQANIISKKGHKVTSIDINPLSPQIHLVQKGDITKLDFADDSFDLIYSSNMLQEIYNIDKAFMEMKRVLKKDGIIIHIVPSSWWSIITNFWHYCLIPKYLIKSNKIQQIFNSKKVTNIDIQNNKEENKNSKSTTNLKKLFFHPLGANSSFVHEIFYFSKSYWKKSFNNNQFEIINEKNCPYFYSGYSVFRFKFLSFRKFLGKLGMTSCFCFVMKNE
jgi:ubiquinone/menaquinone biosynthesis C-methylase UbiE